MSLIPENQYAVLQSASDVAAVSESAINDSEEIAVAKLINSSANTGQTAVLYNHALTDETISTLEGQGYTVKQRPAAFCADPRYQYIISWEDA